MKRLFWSVALWVAAGVAQAASDDAGRLLGGADAPSVARCQWGQKVVGVAQGGVLAGLSRDAAMSKVEQLGYPHAWMPRMSQVITLETYRVGSRAPVEHLQKTYYDDCLNYYSSRRSEAN